MAHDADTTQTLMAIEYQQTGRVLTSLNTLRRVPYDFKLACSQAQVRSDAASPFAAWQTGALPQWSPKLYETHDYPLSWDGQTLLSLHEYGYLIRQNLSQPDQTQRLMPPADIDPSACQQEQNRLYCLDYQRQGHYLDLQAEKLHLKPLLDMPWQKQQIGLELTQTWNTTKHVILQRRQRQVLLYPSPGGPVWVTDQGHFFRQGEIPLAEMPYLVQGLKSVDLPSRLESWTEVARALKGLPPLRQSGLKLQFGELKNEN